MAYEIIIALSLVLYWPIGLANGKQDCVKFVQDGPSVLGDETKLEFHVTDPPNNFRIRVLCNRKEITVFESRDGINTFLQPCPHRYDCVWNEISRRFVVTINQTTLIDDGEWHYTYLGQMGCIEDSFLAVSVIDMASTRVASVTMGNPYEGQNYTMSCDIISGDPLTGVAYEWKRDGVTQVETGATLTINEVERSMHGSNYTCAADNGAGIGEHGSALTLIVWSKPLVTASGALNVKKGSKCTLGCFLRDGYPKEMIDIKWMKNGAALLRPGTVGGTIDNPNLTLLNVTLEDAGDYVCILSNIVGIGHSQAVTVEVIAEYSTMYADRRNIGVIVGTTVGVLLAVVIFAAGISVWIVRRHRKESKDKTLSETLEDHEEQEADRISQV